MYDIYFINSDKKRDKKFIATRLRDFTIYNDTNCMVGSDINYDECEQIIDNSNFIFILFNESMDLNIIKNKLSIAKRLNKPMYLFGQNKFTPIELIKICNNSNCKVEFEIERKWLISKNLFNYLKSYAEKNPLTKDSIKNYNIIQFYDVDSVRYRKETYQDNDIRYIKCIKSDTGNFERYEIESNISETEYISKFNNLFPMKYIEKSRFTIPIYKIDAVLELNAINISPNNILYVAEIEYHDDNYMTDDLNHVLEFFEYDNISDSIYEISSINGFSNKDILKLDENNVNKFIEFTNLLCEDCIINKKEDI